MVAALVLAERATRHFEHRGYWHVAKYLGSGADGERARVRVGSALVQLPLSDPYWARLVSGGYEYEPEVAEFLPKVLGDEADFVDVGANIGYWSVWVSQRYPSARVVAIEPNPEMVQLLEVNNALNGDRFQVIQAAVAPDGGTVALNVPPGSGGHAAAHVMSDEGDRGGGQVVSVEARSLDEILTSFRRPGRPLLVKMDIEGLEADVLSSSDQIRDGSIAVLYEDHGADRDCRPTAFLLSVPERSTYFLRPEGGVVELDSVEQLAALKRRQQVGYNCLSVVRGSDWHASAERLRTPLAL